MPGLLTLHTDLKSLKYGSDRKGGGDSGQPYIKTDINNIDNLPNVIRFNSIDDGLIRGGTIGATTSSTVDTLRIGKFLKDVPKGFLFVNRQVGLQLSNPKLEHRKLNINRPTSGQGFLTNVGNFILNTANTIENAVGPTRVYNLGINTLAQIPVNAFGGHIVRHGFLPISDSSKYYGPVVYDNNFLNNSNRLIDLSKKFKLGDQKLNQIINNPLINRINQISGFINNIFGTSLPSINLNNKETIIDEYIGGPNSVYGIGKTTIKRYDNTEDSFKITLLKNFSNQFAGKTRDINDGPKDINLKEVIGKGNNSISEFPGILEPELPRNVYGNILTYSNISKINKNQKTILATTYGIGEKLIGLSTSSAVNQFNIIATGSEGKPLIISGSIAYSSNTIPGGKIKYINTLGDAVIINKSNWKDASREIRIGSGRKDFINLTPIFTSTIGSNGLTVTIEGKNYTINDLVKFKIEAINTDNPNESDFMIFRAYITSFEDGTNAAWDPIKYIGRGEEFYIYNGFTRKINIGFKVAALSSKEMEPMYQKLNYLMSNLMPDYNNNLMRGPFSRMTIGNWIDSQPGIITSLNYNVSQDSPWEIAINEPTLEGSKEMVLPHIVDVSLSFIPIGSKTQNKNLNPRKSPFQSNIAQNYNGLNEKSNYINPTGSLKRGIVGGFPNIIN